MSVNVYLVRMIKQDTTFVNEEQETKTGVKYQKVAWNGIRLSHIDENGYPVFTMSSLDDDPPEAITGAHISMVTVKMSFVADFYRRLGVYTLPDITRLEGGIWRGTATLDMHPTTRWYELSIKAPSLSTARNLYHGIRTGALQPFEAWDGQQAMSEAETTETD